MSGYDVLSIALIVLAALDLAVTVVLVRGALRLKYVALEERATVSTVLSLMALGLAALGAARLLHVTVSPDLTTIIIVLVFLGISVPQLVWGWAYLTGRFDGRD